MTVKGHNTLMILIFVLMISIEISVKSINNNVFVTWGGLENEIG